MRPPAAIRRRSNSSDLGLAWKNGAFALRFFIDIRHSHGQIRSSRAAHGQRLRTRLKTRERRYEGVSMKQMAIAALIGAAAGAAGAVAVVEFKYAPGTWFSISGDPAKMQAETRAIARPAAGGVHCLYRSERYNPGDVLTVTDAGIKLACTSGANGSGLWLQVVQAQGTH
jgi:hypothetical protein